MSGKLQGKRTVGIACYNEISKTHSLKFIEFQKKFNNMKEEDIDNIKKEIINIEEKITTLNNEIDSN